MGARKVIKSNNDLPRQLLDNMLSAYLEDKVQFFLMDHLEDLEKGFVFL